MHKGGSGAGWVGGLGCPLAVGLIARRVGVRGVGGSCATWRMSRMCGRGGFVDGTIVGGGMKAGCREARRSTFAEIAVEAFAKSKFQMWARWESWGRAVLDGVAGVGCGGSLICWSRRTTFWNWARCFARYVCVRAGDGVAFMTLSLCVPSVLSRSWALVLRCLPLALFSSLVRSTRAGCMAYAAGGYASRVRVG